jgi:hypothetical protein
MVPEQMRNQQQPEEIRNQQQPEEIVRWIASLGASTADALATRLNVGLPSARARLLRAERAGLVRRSRPLSGRLVLYTATRKGLAQAGAHGIDPCRVSIANASHLATCARVAAILERVYPDHLVTGERELRRDERERCGPLASARLGNGARGEERLHRPDLVLYSRDVQGQLPVAVEVELTVKAPRRLTAICRAWARCREVDGVIYLVAPDVERPLARAVEQAGAQERVVVLPIGLLCGPSVQ